MEKYLDTIATSLNNGLYLCQLPTGYGKTYNIIQHMISRLDHMESGEQILYITQLKKNLAGDELKKEFTEKSQYDDNVLVVKSILDHYLDAFEPPKKEYKVVPLEFQSRAYDKVVRALEQYQEITQRGAQFKVFNSQEIEAKFVDYEREFRREIKAKLKALDATPKEILKNMKNPRDKFHWVGKLYPSIYIDDYKIIIMTVNKFFTPHVSLVEPTYEYYSSKFLKNTTVFIDEVDATKAVIEDVIIKKSIDQAAEIINLFNKIYKGFNVEDFNKELKDCMAIIDCRIRIGTEPTTLAKRQNTSAQLIKFGTHIKEKYHTNISYKLLEDKKDLSYKVLFYDGEFLTINKKGRQFKCQLNEETGQVDMDHVTDQDRAKIGKRELLGPGVFPLQECLYELEAYLASMRAYINSWAKEYQGMNNQSRPEYLNEMLLEEAINTIGEKLNLTPNELQVLMGPERRSILTSSEYYLRDPLIHEKGFSYYICKDNNNHADTTKIECFRVPYTPEKYLLHMAKTTKVIGVSATAQVDTVIGNYDLKYLGNALGPDFHPTPLELKMRIKKELSQRSQPYQNEDIQLLVDLVGKEFEEKASLTMREYETKCTQMLRKAIKNNSPELSDRIPELVAAASNKIHTYMNNESSDISENNSYQIERYYKFMYNVVVFLSSDDIQSMLHLGMMLPKTDSATNEYAYELLEGIFKIFADGINPTLNEKQNLCILGGSDYEAKKEDILEELGQGKKLMILSSYTTLGAGQNLKYKLIEDRKTVTLGTYNPKDSRYKYKDIDAIYLGEVTNILPNIYTGRGIATVEALSRIMQVERLHSNYELDRSHKILDIRNTFKSYSNTPLTGQSVSLVATSSYVNTAQRTIIQALGRLCRTFQKNPTIYIGLDYKMLDKMNVEELDKLIQTPELEALSNAIKGEINYNSLTVQDKINTIKKEKLQMKARILSTKTHRWLMKQLEEPWTYESSRIWQELRGFLLTHPTLSRQEYDQYTGDIPIDLFYLTSGETSAKYLYTQSADFGDVYISFSPYKAQFFKDCNLDINTKAKIHEMNEYTSGLPELLKYPSAREFFQSNNYATTFKPNEYMMVPAIFNNFYKGILGEEVGRYIWEKEIQVPLQAIEEVTDFEKFDFKIAEGIYIDFKNWSKGSRVEGQKEHEKIKRKMQQIGARLIFLVNVQGDHTYSPRNNKKDGIVEIPCLINKEGQPVLENIDLIKDILRGEKHVIHQ